jgi:1-acyl-sn-glycerol-3-phosphate acyltransferase
VAKPSRAELTAAAAAIKPVELITDPVFHGVENVPADGAALLVGNHAMYGLDLPLLVLGVERETGRMPRGLGDHGHFKIPGWGDLLTRFGAVDGTPENTRELLAAGELVLVFPGGAREVAKRKGEEYDLIWKDRLGFARLAAEQGYPIVPFGAVGGDDAYDVAIDADSPIYKPLRALLSKAGMRDDFLWPVSTGAGPTALPKPQRLYFSFAEPVATDEYAGRSEDEEALQELRDRVRYAVEDRIDFMLRERERDPDRNLLRRLLPV